MRLKVIVLDLELSPRARRMAAAALGVALALAGGAVAYANVPHTWADGDTLNASDLNGNFANLDGRLGLLEKAAAPPTVTAWTTYAPTVTAGATPVTATAESSASTMAQWRRVGDTLEVQIDTLHPTCQTAGALFWSLPAGLMPDTAKIPAGNSYLGTAVTWNQGTAQIGTANVLAQGPQSKVALQQGPSVVQCSTIGNGGVVRMTFAVPIAGWDVNN